MELIKMSEIVVKKSRFISYYYSVESVAEVKSILDSLKKEHKKAKHIPYAYIIDNEIKKTDDKEPSNTAGGPILNVLDKRELNHCLVVIVRYFGGIKLGAGGLIRAYGAACRDVLDK